MTVTVASKDLSQKVQDYLLTTSPKGAITPYPTFSTAKQKALQAKARSGAIADAKSKAKQNASDLDTKIGKVIEIKDSPTFGGVYPMSVKAGAADIAAATTTESGSLTIQAGQNELNYSVEVVFSLK